MFRTSKHRIFSNAGKYDSDDGDSGDDDNDGDSGDDDDDGDSGGDWVSQVVVATSCR